MYVLNSLRSNFPIGDFGTASPVKSSRVKSHLANALKGQVDGSGFDHPLKITLQKNS